MARLCFYPSPWASGEIRARQVVERLGDIAVLSPRKISPYDVCIFVKCWPDGDVLRYVKHIYIDTIDSYACVRWLKEHPTVSAISISRLGAKYINEQIGYRNNCFIREHHCNFERNRIVVKKPQVVGYVGELENFNLGIETAIKLVEEVGMRFVWLSEFKSRQDVCMFYRTIDIQLTYRKDVDDYGKASGVLKNPLKLANAGSFGIPTIAYPEPTYVDEWEGHFMPALNCDSIVYWLDRLRSSPDFYAEQSQLALRRAEYYHIDSVLPIYKSLLEGSTRPTVNRAVNGSKELYCNYPFEERIARRGTEHMDVQKSLDNLLTIRAVFAKHKIPMWLMFGTLLGVVRDKKLISHDRDTDIGVFASDIDKIVEAIKELKESGFELIRTDAFDNVLTVMRNDEYTDFYVFRLNDDCYTCEQRGMRAKIKRAHFDNLCSLDFAGASFSIPSECEKLFVDWYGNDWRKSIENKWALCEGS